MNIRALHFIVPLLIALTSFGAADTPELFRDPTQPVEARVADLLSRLTLREKTGLMHNMSDGLPRFGVPRYDWWNEALHGVARAGEATVFPQAIGLAAMWDEPFLHSVATAISTEARAKYHDALRRNHHERYHGLTFWSPNINIFRDPRWGRGQETYGEDPYLTSRLGVAFVRGMQGDDVYYLKSAACAKHYAVHSGPEPLRSTMNVQPDPADLYETYLPAFEALVREAKVESVMTAYNAVNGEPCVLNKMLYEHLRKWGFNGHVVSDCGAIYSLAHRYRLVKSMPEAAAAAVKAGLCVRCDLDEDMLPNAIREGIISGKEIDAGVVPLLRTMFRLGMFDSADRVPWARTLITANNTPAHQALALEAARKSIVLLKNDGLLPLKRERYQRIAVIGPNADSLDALLGNYHGTPTAPVTVLKGLLTALAPDVIVDYAKGCDHVGRAPGLGIVPRTALIAGDYRTMPDGDYAGLNGEFFANKKLQGEPLHKQRDHQIAFEWQDKPAIPGLSLDGFSVRWQGSLLTNLLGEHEITVRSNGAVRLYLNGKLVIDAWTPGEKAPSVKWMFGENAETPLKLEYAHLGGPAQIALEWNPPPSDDGFAMALEHARSADLIIFAGGITPRLEGEEMKVETDGFKGGDRSKIELPSIQQQLLEQLAALGKPIVYLNLSGSAVAFPWLDRYANAIVQAWYPGQAGGTAVADVLLGAYNPSGRLPVTFYRSTEDLPAFEDYAMANRTYRYFTGQPLYYFGHGLSYTRFNYANLRVTKGATPNTFAVTLDVTNVGDREGEEVVQLYLREPETTNPRTTQSLAGFKRVAIPRGAKQTVALELTPQSFRRWSTAKNDYAAPIGEWRVMVGASAADIRLSGAAIVE